MQKKDLSKLYTCTHGNCHQIANIVQLTSFHSLFELDV